MRGESLTKSRQPIGYGSMSSMVRGWLALTLVLGWGAAVLGAHNPDDSWATLRLVGDTLEIDAEMSTETAMTLLGVPIGTQPGPEDRNELIGPLTKAAGKIYRFSIGERVLKLQSAQVEMREEDGVAFHLVYEKPAALAGPLTCYAQFLEHTTPEHRTAVTLVDAKGKVVGGDMLDLYRTAVVIPLPAKTGD